MRSNQSLALGIGTAMLVLLAAPAAQAQSVTFSDITDAVPGRFFNAAASAPDPNNPNTLVIGFNSGLDPSNWKLNDFRASTAPFSHLTASDTLSARIHAPEGYYISKVTYSQRGTGFVLRTGRAAGASNWVVDDMADDLGTYATNPSLTRTVDLTGMNKTFVPVSITTGLFAFSTPTLGAAQVAVTSAHITVEVLPIEQPSEPAIEEPLDEAIKDPVEEAIKEPTEGSAGGTTVIPG
jgi:hypothetical protein